MDTTVSKKFLTLVDWLPESWIIRYLNPELYFTWILNHLLAEPELNHFSESFSHGGNLPESTWIILPESFSYGKTNTWIILYGKLPGSWNKSELWTSSAGTTINNLPGSIFRSPLRTIFYAEAAQTHTRKDNILFLAAARSYSVEDNMLFHGGNVFGKQHAILSATVLPNVRQHEH